MKKNFIAKNPLFSFLLLFLFWLCGINAKAQNIGINSTGANAHPSALLDIDALSTPSLGVLIPRISLQATNLAAPVTSPATSLLVYNTASASSGTTAVVPGYYYWDGLQWVRFANGLNTTDSQTLSITGNTLNISNGNSVNLSGIGGFTHYIGEIFGGGVISHLWKDNFGLEHGIITSTVDIGTTSLWGCDATSLVGAQSPWNGAANTATIVANCVAGTAAQLCDVYAGAGFTDWYLPSINELQSIFSNLTEVNRILQSIGGEPLEFSPSHALYYYWSSSENGTFNAWLIDTFNGCLKGVPKTIGGVAYVRAVRSF